MRISDIVTESWPGPTGTNPVKLEDFIAIANNDSHPHSALIHQALLKSKKQIYRGFFGFENNIYTIDISKTPIRQSANTANYYTWWIDEISQKWKRFPKRSRSFICSTEFNIAGGYGMEFLMIPMKPTVVGQCPEQDFWESFGFTYSPNDFNELISRLLQNNLGNEINLSSSAGFEHAVNEYNKILITDSSARMRFQQAMNRVSGGMKTFNDTNLSTAIDSYYDPKNNGFQLKQWPNDTLDDNVEVWFSESCYMVPSDMMDDIRDQI